MKVYMIRHGEADYSKVDEEKFIGFGRDLAPLKNYDDLDIKLDQIKNAEIIISSPITRAMHTAAYIMKETDLNLNVNILLHEWMPDLTQQYSSTEEMFKLYREFLKYKGQHINDEQVWETLESIQSRIRKSLNAYYGLYETIIIVTHGMVCRVCMGNKNMEYGEIVEFDYSPEYEFPALF